MRAAPDYRRDHRPMGAVHAERAESRCTASGTLDFCHKRPTLLHVCLDCQIARNRAGRAASRDRLSRDLHLNQDRRCFGLGTGLTPEFVPTPSSFALAADAQPAAWRARVFTVVLRIAAIFGTLVYVPSVILATRAHLPGVVLTDTLAMVFVFAMLFGTRIPYRTRAAIFCAAVYLLGCGLLVWVGSLSHLYLVAFAVLTTLLLGVRAGITAAMLGTISVFVILSIGFAKVGSGIAVADYPLGGPGVVTMNFALVNFVLTIGVGAVLTTLERALADEIASGVSLERERATLRTFIDTVPDVAYMKDRDGRFQLVNAAAVEAAGFAHADAMLGTTVFDIYPKEFAEQVHADDMAVMSGQIAMHRESTATAVDGRAEWYLSAKVPIADRNGDTTGLIGISRNITDRRRLEDELRQSQKMEAVGQLAGGIAHDFNNLLTVILGYSEVLLVDAEGNESIVQSATAITDAAERAASLTRQLLAFSRRTMLQPRRVEVNALITNVGRLLGRLIGDTIDFRLQLGDDVPDIRVDPGQLDQVMMNLAVNARDAMPGGGTLTIATVPCELTAAAAARLELPAGAYARVSITDDGTGMSKEVVARIFEPFFTTKGVGNGTGLGLSMVFGIVRQSGGAIEVESAPGQGSTFRLYFPQAGDDPVREYDVVPPTRVQQAPVLNESPIES